MIANRRVIGIACALFVSATAALSWAQEYPTKPILMIQSSTAGAGPDAFLRLGAQQMSTAMKQAVPIESRPGGGGTVAAVAVKNAAPDGYTLLFNHAGNMIMDPLLGPVPFDTLKDFKPVAIAYYTVAIFVVPGTSPVKTFPELMAFAKTKPGGLFYGSGATTIDLMVGIVSRGSGGKFTSVQYKGTAQAMLDVAAGRLDFSMSTPQPAVMGLVNDGKLRVIAMVAPTRNEQLPWPTLLESGVDFPRTLTWWGWFVPAGTPDAIVRTLHREIVHAFSSAQVRDLALKQGAMLTLSESPEEFVKVIAADRINVAKVIKEIGLKTPQ